MGKHKKHKHHGHSSSSSSSSSSSDSSDEEFKHLPKHERKMRKKMKKQMKKGGVVHGHPMGVHGHPGHHPPGHGHTGYPAQPGYGAPGMVPPPAQGSYSGGGFVAPPGGYPAGQAGYPAAPNPAYPPAGGYPQGTMPPPSNYAPQPGYPAQPSGYPAQPGYSAQPGYPSEGGFVPPPSTGAAPSSGGFVAPPGGYGQQQPGAGGYPTGAPSYPQQGPAAGAPGVPPQHQPPQQPAYMGAAPGVPGATAGMGAMNLGGGGKGEVQRPTIRPANPFSAERDAEVLRKAMKGIGTDEKAIVDVISARSNAQRQQILAMFKTMYGKDLIADLKSELSGDLEELIIALFKPTTYFDAWSLHKAMSGIGTKEAVLIEILCTRTNAEIKEIVHCYKQHFGRSLEQDITSETSGHFKRLLVSCCQGNRNELTPDQQQRLAHQGLDAVVDRALAQQDAQKLYQAGEKKWGTDESAFLQVMAVRNYYQLRATFQEYQKVAGRDILSSVGREFSGDVEDGFKALILSAMNRPLYFANQLHKALSGFGTKDSTLIRIVVSRSEIDLQDIKDEYLVNHQKPLRAAVSSDTSGDYKKLLLGLIGM